MASNSGWNKRLIPKDKDDYVVPFNTSYPALSTDRLDVILSNLRSSIKKKEDRFAAEPLVEDSERPDKVQNQGNGSSVRNKTAGRSTDIIRRQTSKASDFITQDKPINFVRLHPHNVNKDGEAKLRENDAFRRNDVNVRRDHSRCRRYDANAAKGDVTRESCDVENRHGHVSTSKTEKYHEKSDKRRFSADCRLPEYKKFDVECKRTDVDSGGNDVDKKRSDVIFSKVNDVERRRSYVDIRRENRTVGHGTQSESSKEATSAEKTLYSRKAYTPDISRRFVSFERNPFLLSDKPQFSPPKRFSLSEQFRRITNPVLTPNREDLKAVDGSVLLDHEEQEVEVKSPAVAVTSEPLFGKQEAEVAERKSNKNICDSGPLDSFMNRYVRTAETTRAPAEDAKSPGRIRNTEPGHVNISSISAQSRNTASVESSTSSGYLKTTNNGPSCDQSKVSEATSSGAPEQGQRRLSELSQSRSTDHEGATETGFIRNNGSLSVSFADEAEFLDGGRRKPLTRKWFVDISDIPVRNFGSMPLAGRVNPTGCSSSSSSSDTQSDSSRRNSQSIKPCLKVRRENGAPEGVSPAQEKELVCCSLNGGRIPVTCRKSRSFRDMKSPGIEDRHEQQIVNLASGNDITYRRLTRPKTSGIVRSSSLRTIYAGPLKCAPHASNTMPASSSAISAESNELAATSKCGHKKPIATYEVDDDDEDRGHALISDRYRQMLTRSIDHQLFPVTTGPPRDGGPSKLGGGFMPPDGARRDFVIYI